MLPDAAVTAPPGAGLCTLCAPDEEDEGGSGYVMAATSFGGPGFDPDTALVVSIDYWLSGYLIYLVEIDGEYYPYREFMTWIS